MKKKKRAIGRKGNVSVSSERNGGKVEQNVREEQKIIIKTGGKGSGIWSIIIAVLIVAALGWFLFYTSSGQSAFGKVADFSSVFFSRLGSLMSGSSAEYGWINPQAVPVEEKKDIGVKITKFAVEDKLYQLTGTSRTDRGDYVKAQAEINAINIDEELNLDFSCYMDIGEAKNKQRVEGEVRVQPSESRDYSGTVSKNIVAGQSKMFVVSCRIPKTGIDMDKIKTNDFYGNLKLEVLYNTKTESLLRVYTYDADPCSEQCKKKIELWKSSLNNEKPSLLYGDDVMSQTDGGALNGFLSIKPRQPILSAGTRFVSISLKNTKWQTGRLAKLEKVEFLPYGGIEIDEEECDAFSNGNLKQSIIDTVNNEDCRQKENIDTDDCLFGVDVDNLKFNCAVIIADSDLAKEEISYDFFKANFEYSYVVTGSVKAHFKVAGEQGNTE